MPHRIPDVLPARSTSVVPATRTTAILSRAGLVLCALLAGAAMTIGPVSTASAQVDPTKLPRDAGRRHSPFPKLDDKAPLQDRMLRRSDARAITLTVEVAVNPSRVYDSAGNVAPSNFRYTSGMFIFPMPTSSGSHDLVRNGLKSELKFNDKTIEVEPKVQDNLAAGTRLLRWEMANLEGRNATLKLTIPMLTRSTKADESLLREVPWPKGGFSNTGQSALQPQMFVEWTNDPNEVPETQKAFAAAAARYLNNADPKTLKPYVVAKMIAAGVLREIQPSGNGVRQNRNGSINSIELNGAGSVFKNNRGTEPDVVSYFVGTLRAAGIPARTVIGVDASDSVSGGLNPAFSGSSKERLYTWAEFCLVCPDTGRDVWIPVDIIRQRKSGSRPPALDREWKYFGSHEDLEYLLPLAFQFAPPTSASPAGQKPLPPAVWTWSSAPATAEADMSIRFDASNTPRRSSNDKNNNRQRR
ncbi:MAG: transglutaminase-like domain-containing protein [Phycisphaerales bacterium]|jgi:hypothetical protein|nr:transglutaminase-like domain-containing protein [Phycisphaeraceae bacterium]